MQDRATFDSELLKLRPKLFSFAFGLTQNRERAEDLVQDTLLRMMERYKQFTLGTNMGAWANVILRNLFLSERRSASRRRTDAIENYEPFLTSNATPADQVCLVSELEQMLKIIPAAYREIVKSICIEGLSYEEAAAEADVSVGAVKSRLWRSRSVLEMLLGF